MAKKAKSPQASKKPVSKTVKKSSAAKDKVATKKPPSRRKHRRALRKQERAETSKLASWWTLSRQTMKFITGNSRVFGRMIGIYGVLYFLLARTSPEFALNDISDYIETEQAVNSGLSRVGVLLDITLTGNNTPTISVVYGLILFVVVSLAIFWTIRAIRNEQTINARDGFYQGLTGFVPYICVWLMIAFQMVPFAIGAAIYSVAVTSSAVVGGLEEAFFVILWFVLSLPTLYWLGSSLLATVVASIPGYYPMQALNAAKDLVGQRRGMVARRLLGGIVFFGAVFVIVLLIAIVLIPSLAYIVRDIMLIVAPFIFSVYLYKIYEELLADE